LIHSFIPLEDMGLHNATTPENPQSRHANFTVLKLKKSPRAQFSAHGTKTI